MKLYKAETASISVSDGAISSPGVAITVAVAATTPTGGTYTDPGSGGQDTITGTTSATTKVAATETQGPNVNSTYNTTSAANGSFTLNVDNVSGSSQNQIPVAYSVVAIDAWGNRTSAATMSGTDKH
jgi:hypothetical protein